VVQGAGDVRSIVLGPLAVIPLALLCALNLRYLLDLGCSRSRTSYMCNTTLPEPDVAPTTSSKPQSSELASLYSSDLLGLWRRLPIWSSVPKDVSTSEEIRAQEIYNRVDGAVPNSTGRDRPYGQSANTFLGAK
jgi:hypothetical protein